MNKKDNKKTRVKKFRKQRKVPFIGRKSQNLFVFVKKTREQKQRTQNYS